MPVEILSSCPATTTSAAKHVDKASDSFGLNNRLQVNNTGEILQREKTMD